MSHRVRSKRPGLRSFTLLEIMIALGIMAIGISTALGLFTAAAASGRRAEQLVESAHIADTAFAEVAALLSLDKRLEDFPLLDPDTAKLLTIEEGAAPSPALPSPAVAPAANPPNGAAPSASGGVRVVLAGTSLSESPGFKVWGLVSALPDQPDPPIALFCEVHVQWSDKGRNRGESYRTVFLRRASRTDWAPSGQ